jgi:long-chain acyl-CoA synthetase
MIIVSGFNVYPSQIENVIAKHPAVEKVCVIGIPHPYKMHVPKAFIVLKKGTSNTAKVKAEIKSLCRRELSVYAMPKDFEFRSDLPKTLYGKVDYRAIEKEENENK